jgi:HlyD family secretion protein
MRLMGKVPRWLVFLVAIVAIIAILRFVVFRPKPVQVDVARVERGVVEDEVTNTRAGTVKARLRAKLSPQIGGLVVGLPHRKGSHVAAGDLVLKLDDSVQQAQVTLAEKDVRTATASMEQACLAADLAVKDYERGRALAADGITSQQSLDTLETSRDTSRAACQAARAARAQAEAQVGVARAQLALTEVRAPFAGVVADLTTEIGEWITPAPPGVPIPPVLDLIDPGSVYVSAPIDEVDSERVKVGQEVRVTVDSRPGEHFAAHLTRVAAYVLDQLEQNRTVEVEADFDDPAVGEDMLPGTSADVEIILSRRQDVLRVPTAAIAEGSEVLVLKEGRLDGRKITTGLKNWQYTEVTSGLAEGDRVVTVRNSPDIEPGARAVAKPAPQP